MFALFYLTILCAYILVAVVVFRMLRRLDKRLSVVWRFGAVSLPIWFFFGYLLSPSYAEFLKGCETDIKPQVVSPRPVHIPFSEILRCCIRGTAV